MDTFFIVFTRDGASRWLPMGISLDPGTGMHLFTDGPFTLFATEEEAGNWVTDAAAFHEDGVSDYRIESVDVIHPPR